MTHDEIRTALITTLQADATLDAAIETWLKYLIDTGQLSYPAVYVGTIVQPFDGVCGTDKQYTTIADPMRITVGILSNTHAAATSELGTLYEAVYTAIMATPTLSLSDFKVHSIASITTKPIPKCGRSIIRAEMTLNATCQE